MLKHLLCQGNRGGFFILKKDNYNELSRVLIRFIDERREEGR
jgi:hypothetical protein